MVLAENPPTKDVKTTHKILHTQGSQCLVRYGVAPAYFILKEQFNKSIKTTGDSPSLFAEAVPPRLISIVRPIRKT